MKSKDSLTTDTQKYLPNQISPFLTYEREDREVTRDVREKPQFVKGLVSLTFKNPNETFVMGPFDLSDYEKGFPSKVIVYLHPETALKLANQILKDMES